MFYNHYPNRKDRRKPYFDSRAVDKTCKNHGSCPWCIGKRVHKVRKKLVALEDQLRDLYED